MCYGWVAHTNLATVNTQSIFEHRREIVVVHHLGLSRTYMLRHKWGHTTCNQHKFCLFTLLAAIVNPYLTCDVIDTKVNELNQD